MNAIVSFELFRPAGDAPIYRQIISFLQRGLAAGQIACGDELPSRRVLSAMLGVNPNTVQKAYRLLEDEGLIVSTPGAKSVVAASEDDIARIRRELTAHQACEAVAALRQLGLTKEDALRAVAELWDTEREEAET